MVHFHIPNGNILKGLGNEDVGIFFGYLEYFAFNWYILWSYLEYFAVNWYTLWSFGILFPFWYNLHQDKTGNLAQGAGYKGADSLISWLGNN
jgi:hypothetical protein